MDPKWFQNGQKWTISWPKITPKKSQILIQVRISETKIDSCPSVCLVPPSSHLNPIFRDISIYALLPLFREPFVARHSCHTSVISIEWMLIPLHVRDSLFPFLYIEMHLLLYLKGFFEAKRCLSCPLLWTK